MKKSAYLLTTLLLVCIYPLCNAQQREQRPVSPFNVVKAGGLVVVYLTEGDKESLEVQVKGVGLKDIITEVKGGALHIRTEGNYNGEDIKVYVTYKQLKAVYVDEAAKIFSNSAIKGGDLEVFIAGAGDAKLEVAVDELKINMKDAGNLDVSGRCRSQKVISSNGGLTNDQLSVGG